MQVALLGGTGDLGEGLALRWARDTAHDVLIGSRDADRAANEAAGYETELHSRGIDVSIQGCENSEAAARANVIVCTVPAYNLVDTIGAVADGLEAGDVLVTPAVGLKRDGDGVQYNRPGAGSVTALAANATPDGVPVVGAFHSLAADRLANLAIDLNVDTVVVGDDEDAVETVVALAEDIDGVGTLSAGGIENAGEAEALVALLINVSTNNDGIHDAGVTFR